MFHDAIFQTKIKFPLQSRLEILLFFITAVAQEVTILLNQSTGCSVSGSASWDQIVMSDTPTCLGFKMNQTALETELLYILFLHSGAPLNLKTN